MALKSILPLGNWDNAPTLNVANLQAAAAKAQQLGYERAEIIVGGVRIWIEAAAPPAPNPKPASLAALCAVPPRPALFGRHPSDTSKP